MDFTKLPPLKITKTYSSLNNIVVEAVQSAKPPERLTVSQAAEKYVYLKNPGSYIGPWKNSTVKYMVEPMDCLTDSDLQALIFVGGAQTGKTQSLLLNWLTYSVCVDPMDMIVYSPSMSSARDFSIRRVDRLHEHSEAVGSKLGYSADSDNKFDKHYRNGMLFSLSWPSATELAGKPIPRVGLTDYDRMVEDVDGEGSPFDLASKRTTTFGSFGMTVAESSPSRQITNHRWIAKTPHEAPPTTGILDLYNRGDRRRWYWPCPHCETYFEGTFEMLEWDEKEDDISTSETVRMLCPHCHSAISPSHRYEMNQLGTWLKDGQIIDKNWKVIGQGVRSSYASFWLRGVAAAFVTWQKLVETYLTLTRMYESSGDEGALQKFYNTDLAEIYIPKSLESIRVPEALKSRSENLGNKVVPLGTRFLIATVDVQKNMFVVQVHGICPGSPFDMVIIDTFKVYKSKRYDEDGDALWIKPATYLEDWDLLESEVMDKDYPLADNSGRLMSIKMVASDSGGKEGVTTNAYNFYRKLKSENKHGRFHLLKGDPNPNAVRTRVSYPDSQRKDRNAGARGDIPVLLLNSNSLKDTLSGRLDCVEPGKGMIRFPDWLPDTFYMELCAETRTHKGWEAKSGVRNEHWDLSYYAIGVCISKLINIERLDWSNPPKWADEWDKNELVRGGEAPKPFAQTEKTDYDFAELAKRLA